MNKIEIKKYRDVLDKLLPIIQKARDMEAAHADLLSQVHPTYRKSAVNLIHYLAFRSFNIDQLQSDLRCLGLPSLTTIEAFVMRGLLNLENILVHMIRINKTIDIKGSVSFQKSEKIMARNNRLLFGNKSKNRGTRIMVTLPSIAAKDPEYVLRLMAMGMNCARINCAHDNIDDWSSMIDNIRLANKKLKKKCKIAIDIAGPKLRTGPMIAGPKVIHIKPQRDDRGNVIQPARIWVAPPDIPAPDNVMADAILPVDRTLSEKIKMNSSLIFLDSRGKKGKIQIVARDKFGYWGLCSDSVYLETGTELILRKIKQTGREVTRVGELVPKEQFITLSREDILILHRDPRPGEPTKFEDGKLIAPAHISCLLPEAFENVQPGHGIYFNDGKIEGQVESASPAELVIRIRQAKNKGSKLKADMGINLPDSPLSISGLMPKDREDMDFVANNADAVNLSFVNSPEDVLEVQSVLAQRSSKAGIILKIETQKGFAHLPPILLTAMRSCPIGVMIARGDLAIETGWKNFASIQKEIMRMCRAAHLPVIWATQVLENLAKKGTPTRAEITDAAVAQQADCVMLNKGPYIHRAVKMLDKILRRMDRFQNKSAVVLPRLEHADQLILSHKAFDV